jgi:hypothetical protein
MPIFRLNWDLVLEPCARATRQMGIVLPPGPRSRSSYVDDVNCLIIVSSLPLVYINVQISRHLLISDRQGMMPRCQLGKTTRILNRLSV